MQLRASSLALFALVGVAACAPASEEAAPDFGAERAAVDSVLTQLHEAASQGDWPRYFGLYAPDAVFFGTDATERWSLQQFRDYATPTRGWTYRMTERNIFLDADASTAWFDERLWNEGYGESRGTGVLVRGDSGWKVTQYNLTFPIPNDLAGEFTARIKAMATDTTP
jgi:hypothetical protein